MKLSQSVLLIAAAVLVSAALTMVFYSFVYIVEVQQRPMKLVVADFVGFDLNPVNMTLGATTPGNSAARFFIATNVHEMPVRVRVRLSGELSPWLSLTDNHFVLQPGESRKVFVKAEVPEDAAINRTYTGSMRVLFTRIW